MPDGAPNHARREGRRLVPDGGITWRWSRFGLGAAYAVPAVVVAAWSPTLGLAVAVGVLPAAAFGLPPRRPGRAVIPVVGALSALGLLLGSLVASTPVIAVVAVFALAVAASITATSGRLAQLFLLLGLPMFGIGLSFPWGAAVLALAGCMAAGSLYAWLVALAWPERTSPALSPAPVPRGRAMVVYGVLLGTAAATAAAVGFALGLEHVGWATGAVLLVMRPVRGQLILRSAGRAISVMLGALAAACFALVGPGPLLNAALILLVVGALSATQESRWYIAPGFTTFLALTLILSTSSSSPSQRFVERSVETLLGVALALFFGALVPAALSFAARRRGRTCP
ncbi:FUSC family protein [Microbacterium algeriense]|uniref:FUSC family protein n=1 Tax=Microbacterium algeriense TaxID=2615184 RepID=UPI0022E67CC3|nr:FUSC family protein [Microbacterium algeriense]